MSLPGQTYRFGPALASKHRFHGSVNSVGMYSSKGVFQAHTQTITITAYIFLYKLSKTVIDYETIFTKHLHT